MNDDASPPPEPSPREPLPPGAPPCRPRTELGRGATGRVWRAALTAPLGDEPAGAEVALKRLHPEAAADPARRAAFAREVRVALSVRAPGLARGLAAGEDAEGPWLVLRLVPGPTLRERLERGGPLPEPQLRQVARRLAGALRALEEAGWRHGDLKPENVRLDAEGRAVLLDLGFVAPLAAGETPPLAGTPAYLSPEELRGGRGTARSEVHALGVVLHELATGEHPLLPPGAEPRPGALLEARWRPPSLLVPTLTPFLDALLEEMLERDPARRPDLATVEERVREGEAGRWWRERLDRGGDAPPVGATRGAELPLVGRDAELARLLEAAARAASGVGTLLRLSGPAGAGKSRLVSELARRVRTSEAPPLYLRGRCPRFEEARPCQPLLTALAQSLRLPAGTAPGAREAGLLAELLPTWERETLLEALDPAHVGGTRSAVPVALAGWLEALARQRPLLLFLDDLDHADEGTLDVLARLSGRLAGLPALVLLGVDPEHTPRRPEATRRLQERLVAAGQDAVLELGPLDRHAVLELSSALFDHTAPHLRLAQVLHERSRGNPGLVAELVRGLVERGEALPGEHGLSLRIRPDDLPLPASLRQEIGRAYARLDEHDRGWLARLAVCGALIHTPFLLRAWPRASAQELDETLARLSRGRWLAPHGDRYRFRRPALRAAVYRRIPRGERRELHAAVARALRPGPGGRLSLSDAFQRAFHLRAAGRFEELLQLLRPLLRALAERGQPARVLTLGRWGLEALETRGEVERSPHLALEFLWAAADAADRLGHRDQQREWLDRMSELPLDPEQEPEAAGRVYLMFARHSISTGQYASARGMLRNALRLFEAAGHDGLASESLRRLAAVETHIGDFVTARRHVRRAAERAPDDFLRARAEHAAGVIDLLEGDLEGALRRSDRALILLRGSERFETLTVRALAHSLRARVYRGAGRPRRALVSAQKALGFARRAGDRRLEGELQARLGVNLLDVDRAAEAERQLRDALLTATEIEDRRVESLARCFLGVLLAEQEDPEGAVQLERSRRLAGELGQSRTEAVCTALLARVRFPDDPRGALELSGRALELLTRAGAELQDRIVIRGTHAMVLARLDHGDEAEEQVGELRRRIRAANARIESPLLQRRHRLASRQLLAAALSPEGPVYRRVRLLDGPLEPAAEA